MNKLVLMAMEKIKKQNSRRNEGYIISKLHENNLEKINLEESFHKTGKYYTLQMVLINFVMPLI